MPCPLYHQISQRTDSQRAKFIEKVHKPPLWVNVVDFELNGFNASLGVSLTPKSHDALITIYSSLVFLMSAKIVSSRVKRANDVENIKHYLVSKYLLFFIMICSFYPGNCKSPICVRFVNLFAKASRVCDCKYSKGKRGSEEKHEN